MELAPQYWQSPEALKNIYVISPVKGQVPLSSFATYEFTNTALAVNHQGQFAASTLSFNLPENGSLSDSVRAINDTMARIGVPTSMHGTFQGTARAFQKSLESQPWLILAALITVYIVLGVLYESYVHPITILSTLPSAGVGALLALHAVRYRVQHHRADRRDPADRHREEERDHDDRLRAGDRAARRQAARRRRSSRRACCASGRS